MIFISRLLLGRTHHIKPDTSKQSLLNELQSCLWVFYILPVGYYICLGIQRWNCLFLWPYLSSRHIIAKNQRARYNRSIAMKIQRIVPGLPVALTELHYYKRSTLPLFVFKPMKKKPSRQITLERWQHLTWFWIVGEKFGIVFIRNWNNENVVMSGEVTSPLNGKINYGTCKISERIHPKSARTVI